MNLLPETTHIQHNLADYCRTGEHRTIPGSNENKLHHYRRLVFNAVRNTMRQAYPITLNMLGEEKFSQLIENFFKEHDCQTPQVWKLPFEFYEYAKKKKLDRALNMPYFIDLLYFEWIEIEVHTMTDIPLPDFLKDGDLLNDKIILNPEHKIVQLTYPVHTHHHQLLEQHKGRYFVLVFREADTGEVRFVQLTILHAFLIETINNTSKTLAEMLIEARELFNIIDDKMLIQRVKQFFNDLKQQQFFLGYDHQVRTRLQK
ncbi:MAG: putative DNA-binding domain-containing protein [Bacteroidales bacterium]|nr:putative DNA-binding domain-containing protein [Bacteroidales bacterium]